MASVSHFFSKQYPSIWLLLLLAVIFFSACGSPNAEPDIEPDIDVNGVVPQVQEPYPPPEEQAQAAYPGPSLDAPAVRPTPLPTPIPPPLCDIEPPVEIAMSYEEALSDSPVFSEPAIVATNGAGFSIAEWLPDNQRLLVAQGDGAFGTISTLDVTTGEVVEYAQRRDISNFPVWLEEAQGIMFVEATTEGWDLRFSDGQIETILTSELASTWLAKDPLNEQVTAVFSSEPGALMTIDPTGHTEFVTAKQLDEETKRVPLSSGDGYHLAWSPNGAWLVQYKGEELYLINTQTQMICSVDLGDYGEAGIGRIGRAKWSSNSQYLAMTFSGAAPASQLAILDIALGEISTMQLTPEENIWPPSSPTDFTWSPDDKFLIAKVSIGKQDGISQYGLFLVDIHNNNSFRLFPDYTFLGIGQSLTWSPDGSMIAFRCPTTEAGHVCIINVSQ
ncbi:MAG: hypothetical protein WAM60_02150 [Candidatus Promineifilaceae bacterium]